MGAKSEVDVVRGSGIKPFLSWVGSKRKLIKHLVPYIPAQWNTYFEPFLGGGALFFYLAPEKAVVSDCCPALIETYKAVKTNHRAIASFLRPLSPTRDEFDRMKKFSPRSSASKAGQFIFLNKSCWNGLYRVNSDGIFNVPYGMPRTDFLVDEANFGLCAKQLRRKRVSVKLQDFEKIEKDVAAGDFVFFDPPYVTSHNLNGFADWNERIFSWQDQIRLAALARRLVQKGANVLITNADHSDVKYLYADFGYSQIVRSTTLASDKSKRGQTSEAVFFGGPAYLDKIEPVSRRHLTNDGQRRASRP